MIAMRHRLVPFAIVGAVGFVLQAAAFVALTATGWPLVPSTVLSVEAAVLHNFVWHERWTWRDRVGQRGRSRRLVAFVVSTGITSVLGNVVFVLAYATLFHADALVAALSASGTTMLFNFVAADRLVFKCG